MGSSFPAANCCRKSSARHGTHAAARFVLTVQAHLFLVRGCQPGSPMLTDIAGVLIVLSIGILVAHALDAFRSK
jgi:hypothetical protein